MVLKLMSSHCIPTSAVFGRSYNVGVNMHHELGSLVKRLVADLASLRPMLFLVGLQFPSAGK